MRSLLRPTLAALLTTAALAGCGGSDTPGDTRVKTAGVSFDVPPTWELVNEETLALVEGDPDAAVRRKDGSAILTITKGARVPDHLDPAGVALQRSLQKSVPDLRALKGSTVKTRTGTAFSFDLVRDRPDGPARVVLVPAGDGSWVLELSLQPRAEKARAETARIVRSFDD
jgi:hypothetical protein